MTFIVTGSQTIDVGTIRSNAPVLNGTDTGTIDRALAEGTAWWKITNPIAGQTIAVLPDVSIIKYSTSSGIIQDTLAFGGVHLYQARQVISNGQTTVTLEQIAYASDQTDSVLAAQYPGLTSNDTWQKLVIPLGNSGDGWLNEFYLSVNGTSGYIDTVYGPAGVAIPNQGRFLVTTGTITGARDAAWGQWLDVIDLAGGPTGGSGDILTVDLNAPTQVVSDPGLGLGTLADPQNIGNILAPAGSELFAVGDKVYEMVDGRPLGFVETVNSSDVLLADGTSLPDGNTNWQLVVDAVAVDPDTSASVQVDFALSGTATLPITALIEVPSDTDHPLRDRLASWWNNGGESDIIGGDPTSLISEFSQNHPRINAIVQSIEDLTQGDFPSFIYNNKSDDNIRNQTTDFFTEARKSLGDIIKDGLTGSLSIKERIESFKGLRDAMTTYVNGLLDQVTSGIDQFNVPPFETMKLGAAGDQSGTIVPTLTSASQELTGSHLVTGETSQFHPG